MKKVWIVLGVVLIVIITSFILILDIPDWEKLDMDKIKNANAASRIYDSSGKEAFLLSGTQSRIILSSDEIPLHVKRAFIAAEDERFYSHWGIDVKRIASAILNNLKELRYREGASTITQQLIKLTHLTQEKTIKRKANEAYLAIQLENRMSKDEILTAYLNTIYFGEGAYGIESASRTYFGKSASSLSESEAALLAGIIKAPSSYSPYQNAEKALSRRSYVLEKMLSLGYIDKKQYDLSLSAPLPEKRSSAHDKSLWYRDQVIDEACRILDVSADELLTGGYEIYTSFDPDYQNKASLLFDDSTLFPPDAPDETTVQAAFCMIDSKTGAIRALIGGRNYEVERGLNRASSIKRQPGSAFKPISVYAAAVDQYGLSPTSIVDDTRREFDGGYTPSNATDTYYGLVTLREALSRSLNVASVSLIEFTGISAAREYAIRSGIALDSRDNGLSLALGSLTTGVSPLTLACAYAPLANGGRAAVGHTVEKIFNRQGACVYKFAPSNHYVMSEESAYLITSMLATAATTGSAKALSEANIPIAGKTGTVSMDNGNNRDIWTVAYTPDTVACVWMGFDSPSDVRSIPSWAGGSSYPAKLLGKFFDGFPGIPFKTPEGIEKVFLDKYSLDNEHRALLAPSYAPKEYVTEEVYKNGTSPKQQSGNFDTPVPISDLKGEWRDDINVVLSFTSNSDFCDYLVVRSDEAGKEVLPPIRGKKGETVTVEDQFIGDTAVYTIISRNSIMYESGTVLLSPESNSVIMQRKKTFIQQIEELFT